MGRTRRVPRKLLDQSLRAATLASESLVLAVDGIRGVGGRDVADRADADCLGLALPGLIWALRRGWAAQADAPPWGVAAEGSQPTSPPARQTHLPPRSRASAIYIYIYVAG